MPKFSKNGNAFEEMSNERILQYNNFLKGKYSDEYIYQLWQDNCINLKILLERVNAVDIKVFRFSSNILPLYDLLADKYFDDNLKNILKGVGTYAREHGIRLTCHPDQFVVLSSDDQGVIERSINLLKYHADLMDAMALPETPFYAINIHGGKRGNSSKLIDSIAKLPVSVRNRLTLENDERSYSVRDLYEVFKKTNVPIVFDSHHFTFNEDMLTLDQAFNMSVDTWNGIKPLTHLSNTTPGLENATFKDKRKHSDYVHYIPEVQRINNNLGLIDIDMEFKMKNLAIKKAVAEFDIKL